MTKPAPRLPPLASRPDDTVIPEWDCDLPRSNTRCKHGEQDCVICGTSSKRDELHQTRGGLGAFAQASSRFDRRGNRK